MAQARRAQGSQDASVRPTAGQETCLAPDRGKMGTSGSRGAQTLILDGFPDPALARCLSPNGRAHWAVKRRARNVVESVVGLAICEQRLDDSLADCQVRITYRWVFPDHRRRDLDNHSTGVVKVVQDCLARLGLIAADDTSCITGMVTEVVVERGRRALEIVIAPASDGPAAGG